jgi:phospholipid/cholesterol/gamma-HCH transport system permease protein
MSAKRIECPRQLNQDTGRDLLENLKKTRVKRDEKVVLDLTATEEMDSRGGAWVMAIASYVHSRHGEFQWEGHSGTTAEFMALIEPSLVTSKRPAAEKMGFLEDVGAKTIAFCDEAKDGIDLLFDAVYWTVVSPFEGKRFRWGFFMDEAYEMGVRAIQVTLIMNFLLGLTIAMLSAVQIADLGLGIYIADLIIIGFARELGPLMTAVVVSARTGAAVTAELATMVVQDEINALKGMGINPSQFLIAPKLLAMIVVMPILMALGVLAGIVGGTVWGVVAMGYPFDAWTHETILAANIDDFTQGLVKSLTFAVVIILVGCHNGLRVTGGSRGVGLMTTRSVVMDIFFIVLLDMFFATLFYYM